MSEIIAQSDVERYLLLRPLLSAAYNEVQELSKKKPDSVLNTYKVRMVNRILFPLYDLLKSEPSFPYLDTLNTDDLPTNSDVVMIIGQYLRALDMFHDKYYASKTSKWKTESI